MNSVGVFGKGFDCLFGEESRFTAKSSISSMIVSMSKWDVFLDSFLLAAASADAPFTPVLFMFSTPLLLLSSCLAPPPPPPPPCFPSPDSAMGPNTANLSPALEPALSKSSLTVVRQLFWDTCGSGERIDQGPRCPVSSVTFLAAAGDLGLASLLPTSRCCRWLLGLRPRLARRGLAGSGTGWML